MKKVVLVLLGAIALMLTPNGLKAQSSVETKKANSDYKPAFEGQTRISAVVTKMPYEGKMLTAALKRPWGIAAMPNGKFLVTEKGGTMKIVSATGEVGEAINGVPAVASEGQGGLLGICLDPNFSKNRMVYWAFSEPLDNGNLTSVAKGKLSADEKSLEGVTVIYRATPAYKGNLHFGGRVLFAKDGTLFLSTGERSDMETRPQAQDLNSGLGKIIHITTEGKPAKGNPFAGDAKARPELYSYGHRNVQGIALHPGTGDLWETEFGPRGGDEINRVLPGKNYGWPTITYGIEYRGDKIGDAIQQKAGMEQPVYYWDPVISPSGITFHDGRDMAEWKNNLFISALSGMHICRIVIENNKVVGEERLLSGENQRFRDITQGTDGALYAVTDQGRLYRVGKK
ncbi:sorbosone dehydrogenase family protein [Fulvivirgaceae bacterium PWU4]|uniref:Sorbosone dehydrogenase family protein n=1 Tax=Chryseosolibacter histidini TaxID=2782349 RepID=A0AAP2DKG7_9BACT|nr:PQQ-dependent sugar dehydrogenase [Chryseosolibacter histidini]MBT1698041.1 sorbosone dehydrogenase family protein [Chryseosolibacter histidini]